jgi:hypothetical protein
LKNRTGRTRWDLKTLGILIRVIDNKSVLNPDVLVRPVILIHINLVDFLQDIQALGDIAKDCVQLVQRRLYDISQVSEA